MNCLTCGLDTSRKFGEIEFDESSVVQLLPRGMGIAASLLGCLCSDLARSHMCVFGTAKKKRRNRVVNAQTRLPRRPRNYSPRSRDTIKPLPSPESTLMRFHCTCDTNQPLDSFQKTRIRFRVIEMRTPRALQCWPRICDRIQQKESTGS